MGNSSPKMKRLEKISKRLRSTTDKLGKPIEEGIFNTVLMLNALGYKTAMSCEGHIGSSGKLLKHGQPFPWVTITYSNDNVDLAKMNARDRKHYKKKQLKKCYYTMIGIVKLLDEFYYKREYVSSINKIIVTPHIQGELRIQSLSSYFIETHSKSERLHFFTEARREMRQFARFLELKYFLE